MSLIDPKAVVDPGARIAPGVIVGPYAVIGPDVEIDEGCRIGPSTVIRGTTRIGKDNKIYQFCSIGDDPQDRKYGGEATELEIGDGNTIREYVSINRGTVQDAGVTRVGNDNWIMAYVHIAHDCQVGSHTVFANNATLAGHVKVGDYATLGGFTLVHQFCSIGAHSFSAMGTGINMDVPPFIMVSGNPAEAHGLNMEGLRRRGFSEDNIGHLKHAYKHLYRGQLKLEEAIAEIRALEPDCADAAILREFLESQTRGIVR